MDKGQGLAPAPGRLGPGLGLAPGPDPDLRLELPLPSPGGLECGCVLDDDGSLGGGAISTSKAKVAEASLTNNHAATTARYGDRNGDRWK